MKHEAVWLPVLGETAEPGQVKIDWIKLEQVQQAVLAQLGKSAQTLGCEIEVGESKQVAKFTMHIATGGEFHLDRKT